MWLWEAGLRPSELVRVVLAGPERSPELWSCTQRWEVYLGRYRLRRDSTAEGQGAQTLPWRMHPRERKVKVLKQWVLRLLEFRM